VVNEAHRGSILTDPRICIEEARRLLIPVTPQNWDRVRDDADALNLLQAALVHLVYADTEREAFQEQVLAIVFTAYLMGRSAGEGTRPSALSDEVIEWIESLDLSGLVG
jgi:hypothetical protein